MLFPNSIGFSQVDITSNAPAYVSQSNSLKTIATSTGAQRWELSLTTGDLKETEFRHAWAFLNSLSGKAKTFDIVLPLFSKPLGIVTGLVQSLVGHNIGDDTINFANYTAEIGDFIRFAGHSKLYQLVGVAGSSGTIYPPLFNAVSESEIVYVSDLFFTARLNSQVSKLKVKSNNKITKLKFKIIEAF
jgi:hypothetical protein